MQLFSVSCFVSLIWAQSIVWMGSIQINAVTNKSMMLEIGLDSSDCSLCKIFSPVIGNTKSFPYKTYLENKSNT